MERRASPKSLKHLCDKDENGNTIDIVTYQPIPEGRLITVKSGNTVQCFDIDTLYRYWAETPRSPPMNPYTKVKLPKDISDKVRSL